VDGIVSTAGAARFAPLEKLSDEDFRFSLANKLMGQVNLARIGIDYLNDKGSITLTSGILSHQPMVGSAVISLVNAGLEGFTRAAALEAPRGIRVNVVSPPLGYGNPQGAEHGPEPWQTRGRGGAGLC
jgi:NAD(P)-dependent dehydrogenase (short-subunit alcohol dehydrogenase family)